MKKILVLVSIAIVVLLSGCSSKNILADSPIVQARDAHQKKYHSRRNYFPGRFEYRIQPHDRLAIKTYKHNELSGSNILLDSRGNVDLPLLHTVHLAGLTQPQASRKLTNMYKRYLKKSQVHVEVQNKHAYLIGEVRAPGVVPLPNEEMPLLPLIASRGGFLDSANKEKIVILRAVGRRTRADVVDLTNLTSLSYAGMMIRPGDVVYVAPTGLKNFQTKILPIFQMATTMMSPFAVLKGLKGSSDSGTTIITPPSN